MVKNQYEHFGVMLDCSRNAVLKPSMVKKFIDYLVKMGYNTLELYTEDTYEVKGDPCFGYSRGGYTAEEIKDIDKYAIKKGIELIPCIQTLAHFTSLPRWSNVYGDIIDCNDILLVDEEKTYTFIEHLFASLSENFSSRLVNIGFDEAEMLGFGKYFTKHGYQNRFDILIRHLKRIAEIAKKYGFKVHMWSDMFFKFSNKNKYVGLDVVANENVKSLIPNGVDVVYWDYYNTDEELYDHMLSEHEKVSDRTWFAGTAWTSRGVAPYNSYAMKTMKPAMKQVIKHNVKNVLITLWGSDGGECSFFSVLPALYAIRQYSYGNFDEKAIAKGFEQLFNLSFFDFILLDCPNFTDKNILEPSKRCMKLLYNDCFLGLLNNFVKNSGEFCYEEYGNKLLDTSKRMKEFEYIFVTLGTLCLLLDKKAQLGIRTRKAYQDKNNDRLKEIVTDYDITIDRLDKYYQKFRDLWMTENKPFGFEIQDVRLGGLKQRLIHCKERLHQYIDGTIDSIDELEMQTLDLDVPAWDYREIISTSLL